MLPLVGAKAASRIEKTYQPPISGHTNETPYEIHKDRCLGVILSTCCGDCLGAPVEFLTFSESAKRTGGELVRDFSSDRDRVAGCYTDDTEMVMAMADCLTSTREINAERFCEFYCKWFYEEPHRGYGPSVSRLFQLLDTKKITYKNSGTFIHKNGSYANGALMRIAPLALPFMHPDVKKEEVTDDFLYKMVYTASMPTHVNIEAVDAAYLQVQMMMELSKLKNMDEFNPKTFLEWVISKSKSAVRDKLAIVGKILFEENDFDVQEEEENEWKMTYNYIAQVTSFLSQVVGDCEFGYGFQVKAVDALASVLFVFLQYYKSPECLIRIVTMAGDADTTGAIMGALVGSVYGAKWIPQRWFDMIENEEDYGRDAMIILADKLSHLQISTKATSENKDANLLYYTSNDEDIHYETFQSKFQ